MKKFLTVQHDYALPVEWKGKFILVIIFVFLGISWVSCVIITCWLCYLEFVGDGMLLHLTSICGETLTWVNMTWTHMLWRRLPENTFLQLCVLYAWRDLLCLVINIILFYSIIHACSFSDFGELDDWGWGLGLSGWEDCNENYSNSRSKSHTLYQEAQVGRE